MYLVQSHTDWHRVSLSVELFVMTLSMYVLWKSESISHLRSEGVGDGQVNQCIEWWVKQKCLYYYSHVLTSAFYYFASSCWDERTTHYLLHVGGFTQLRAGKFMKEDTRYTLHIPVVTTVITQSIIIITVITTVYSAAPWTLTLYHTRSFDGRTLM